MAAGPAPMISELTAQIVDNFVGNFYDRHVRVPGEHLAIINAIAGRRPAKAEEATRRHLRSVITALLDQHELDQHELDQPKEEAR